MMYFINSCATYQVAFFNWSFCSSMLVFLKALHMHRSKYKDEDIGLVNVEGFMQQTGEALTDILDQHELQLKRLANEKSQRQELVNSTCLLT